MNTSSWSNLQETGGEQSVALLKKYVMNDVGPVWCPVYIAEGTSGKGIGVGKNIERGEEAQRRLGFRLGKFSSLEGNLRAEVWG